MHVILLPAYIQYGEIYNFPSTAFENVLDTEELEEEEEVRPHT